MWSVDVGSCAGNAESRGVEETVEEAKKVALARGHRLAFGLLADMPQEWTDRLAAIGKELRGESQSSDSSRHEVPNSTDENEGTKTP